MDETPFVFDRNRLVNLTTEQLTLESVARYAQDAARFAQETDNFAHDTKDHLDQLQGWLDILWLLLGAYLVFFMQVKFEFCCASSDRKVVKGLSGDGSLSLELGC